MTGRLQTKLATLVTAVAAMIFFGGVALAQDPGDGAPDLDAAIDLLGKTPCEVLDTITLGTGLAESSRRNGLTPRLPIDIGESVDLDVTTDSRTSCEWFSSSEFWFVAMNWSAADPTFIDTSFAGRQAVNGVGERAVLDSDIEGRFVVGDILVRVTNSPPGHSTLTEDRPVTVDVMALFAEAMTGQPQDPIPSPDPDPGGDPSPSPVDPPATEPRTYSCAGQPATIVGTAGPDTIIGTPGNDVIVTLGGKDRVRGMDGHDIICGGGATDVLIGGRGKDRIIGGSGRDRIRGGAGKDSLRGGVGRDRLDGGSGLDVCQIDPDDIFRRRC